MELLNHIFNTLLLTLRDVLPIIVIIFTFQFVILRKAIPHLKQILIGLVYVVLGLGLFLVGLEEALFPLGKLMAEQLTDPASFMVVLKKSANFSTGKTTHGFIYLPHRLVLRRRLLNHH